METARPVQRATKPSRYQADHLNLVLRLIMRGAVPSLPHTSMAWYLTNFTLVSDVYED